MGVPDFSCVDIPGAGHGAKGKAAPGPDAALLALVVVAVLLAGEGQVAADIGPDLVTTDLRPQQGGIPP